MTHRRNATKGAHAHVFYVTRPPHPRSSSGKGPENDAIGARNKVRETLCLFQAVCRKLLHEEKAKPSRQNSHKRVDYLAARILKDKKKYIPVDKKSHWIGSRS